MREELEKKIRGVQLTLEDATRERDQYKRILKEANARVKAYTQELSDLEELLKQDDDNSSKPSG